MAVNKQRVYKIQIDERLREFMYCALAIAGGAPLGNKERATLNSFSDEEIATYRLMFGYIGKYPSDDLVDFTK